jgi:hypothetical protein
VRGAAQSDEACSGTKAGANSRVGEVEGHRAIVRGASPVRLANETAGLSGGLNSACGSAGGICSGAGLQRRRAFEGGRVRGGVSALGSESCIPVLCGAVLCVAKRVWACSRAATHGSQKQPARQKEGRLAEARPNASLGLPGTVEWSASTGVRHKWTWPLTLEGKGKQCIC